MQNPWIGYITRSYEQIKSTVLGQLPTEVPEITDHTENNWLVRMLGVWAGLTEHMNYYIDAASREAHLGSVRRYKNAVKIARMHDYRVQGRGPASADLLFTLSQVAGSDVTVPAGTTCETDDGVQFVTDEELVISAGDLEGTVGATQYTEVNGQTLGTSDGSQNQSFEINERVVDGSLSVRVNSTTWTEVETLGWSVFDQEHFRAGMNENGRMRVLFGDGLNGKIPANGSTIEADRRECLGSDGNVGQLTIVNITSSVSTPGSVEISVENPERASGGVNAEGVGQIKRKMPLSIRTLFRAVTDKDFEDVAVLYQGVAKAKVEEFDCGKTFDLYIAPEGGGIASLSLLSDVQDHIDERKMTTTFPVVKAAGEVRIVLRANVNALPGYANSTVEANVEQNLLNFLSVAEQEIEGSLSIGDLYEVIETTEGVRNSEITVLNTVPYARPLDHTTQLDWSRETLQSSAATVRWRVRNNGSGDFELFKNGSFIGVFQVGVQVQRTEIEFTINNFTGSTAGDQWEFYTYPYYDGSLDLQEPSIPAAIAGDIVLNVTGEI